MLIVAEEEEEERETGRTSEVKAGYLCGSQYYGEGPWSATRPTEKHPGLWWTLVDRMRTHSAVF